MILEQAIEAVGGAQADTEVNVLYMYLLDACEKVFDNELDQATFEEHMRWFFGTKASPLNFFCLSHRATLFYFAPTAGVPDFHA